MGQSLISTPHLQNEEAAYAFIEARIWPDGLVCPHCGSKERIGKMGGKATRIGLYKCYACRKQFTVKIGTIFEDSHVPMHLWLQAIYLLSASKKGFSSHQLHRTLGVTLKTAWFMGHRIREAMKPGNKGMLGENEPVEADETFWGTKEGSIKRRGYGHKNAILSLVERKGEVRSFHVPNVTAKTLKPYLQANINPEAHLMTDDAGQYRVIGPEFAKHDVVCHSAGEYVRGNAHTNSAEGFFSIFKRGMYGVYQHVSDHHLHRYTVEYDFRYNYRAKLGFDDSQRAEKLLCGVVGKRLTYQTTH